MVKKLKATTNQLENPDPTGSNGPPAELLLSNPVSKTKENTNEIDALVPIFFLNESTKNGSFFGHLLKTVGTNMVARLYALGSFGPPELVSMFEHHSLPSPTHYAPRPLQTM